MGPQSCDRLTAPSEVSFMARSSQFQREALKSASDPSSHDTRDPGRGLSNEFLLRLRLLPTTPVATPPAARARGTLV